MSPTAIPTGAPALSAQRIQYRVGHGGFHATIVEDRSSGGSLVYVYDVGARPNTRLLEKAIQRFVARLVSLKIKRVQYVILSHIDDDHVNCLEYLLTALGNEGIGVDTLTLPWLRSRSRLMARSGLPQRGGSNVVTQLLQSDDSIAVYAVSLGFENVLFVEGEAEDDDDDLDNPDDADPQAPSVSPPRSNAPNAKYTVSGMPLSVPHGIPWTLLITHLDPPKKTLRAFDAHVMLETKLDPANPAHHDELITKHKRAIRAAMACAARMTKLSLSGATVSNWSSQSLYSASHAPLVRHTVPHAPADFEMSCVHGWLHTGDLPLHAPKVWDAFDQAWNRHLPGFEVCVALAPHHGSRHGHNAKLYDRFKPSAVVFTFGLGNGTRRGKPVFSMSVNPKPAMKAVRAIAGIKVRLLNNRI